MPHSLRSRIKKLAYQKVISDKDCDRIIAALDYSDKFIDRDYIKDTTIAKAIDLIETEYYEQEYFYNENLADVLYLAIKALQFTDSVTHCKDCKYWTRYDEELHHCTLAGYFIGENGYCLYGKEKE